MKSLLLAVFLLAGNAFAAVPSLAEVRARNFEVVTTEGKRVRLNDLLPAGRPVLIEFWATWCGPCRRSVPHLIGLSKKYPGTLTVVGLTIEDSVKDAAKVRKFVSEHGIPYPTAFASLDVYQFMNQREELRIPKLLVYDPAGNLVEHIVSYPLFASRRIDRAVTRAVSGK